MSELLPGAREALGEVVCGEAPCRCCCCWRPVCRLIRLLTHTDRRCRPPPDTSRRIAIHDRHCDTAHVARGTAAPGWLATQAPEPHSALSKAAAVPRTGACIAATQPSRRPRPHPWGWPPPRRAYGWTGSDRARAAAASEPPQRLPGPRQTHARSCEPADNPRDACGSDLTLRTATHRLQHQQR